MTVEISQNVLKLLTHLKLLKEEFSEFTEINV